MALLITFVTINFLNSTQLPAPNTTRDKPRSLPSTLAIIHARYYSRSLLCRSLLSGRQSPYCALYQSSLKQPKPQPQLPPPQHRAAQLHSSPVSAAIQHQVPISPSPSKARPHAGTIATPTLPAALSSSPPATLTRAQAPAGCTQVKASMRAPAALTATTPICLSTTSPCAAAVAHPPRAIAQRLQRRLLSPRFAGIRRQMMTASALVVLVRVHRTA